MYKFRLYGEDISNTSSSQYKKLNVTLKFYSLVLETIQSISRITERGDKFTWLNQLSPSRASLASRQGARSVNHRVMQV